MASLRKTESKIPQIIDSKLKNVSKIPQRVKNKPKTISAESELKKTSAIITKKAAVNTIDRNKTSEISKKELKSVNFHLKSKAKENKFQQSEKISLEKKHYNGASKSITNGKRIKASNNFSDVLKDKNKIAAKELQKPKPIKDKEENPFCAFKKEIPQMNIEDDDPFKMNAEEKQIKNSNNPSQRQGIQSEVKRTSAVLTKKVAINPVVRNKKYVAEISKKHLTLQIQNKGKKHKFQRPDKISLNKEHLNRAPKIIIEEKVVKNPKHFSQENIEFVADERMKNFILSNKELTPSMLKSCSKVKTSMIERPSLYRRFKLSVDPYKQALADIKDYDLKKQRLSEMPKNGLYASPLQNRNSLYKPLKCVGKPYEEALKSLAELRIHQNIKSIKKKVTFRISGEDQSTETEKKDKNSREKAIEAIQPQLIKMSEKGSEKDTHPTSEFEGNTLTPGNNLFKKCTFDSPSKTDEVLGRRQISDLCFPKQIEEQKRTDCFISKINTSTSPLKKDANNVKVDRYLSPNINHKQKSGENATFSIQAIKNSILKSINPLFNSMRTSDVRQSLFSNQSECFLDKMNPKIFTPQPVSFYPQFKLSEIISPEFLSKRKTDILSCAPINTPLVLKSLSKRELSPVCKKLEFKDSPKEASDSKENSQTFYLQNIMTQQKILDQLAHQECSIFMHEAVFPCEIRNYLQNPVAQILNNGDEMHFVPVPLQKLS